MHWINFPVLFTMIWSGLLIYWNDSDNAYKHPHAVYRVGVGSFTLVRFFPRLVLEGDERALPCDRGARLPLLLCLDLCHQRIAVCAVHHSSPANGGLLFPIGRA
jgi:hypothetical protein